MGMTKYGVIIHRDFLIRARYKTTICDWFRHFLCALVFFLITNQDEDSFIMIGLLNMFRISLFRRILIKNGGLYVCYDGTLMKSFQVLRN